MFLKLFAAAAAVVALGIGGVYLTIDDTPTSIPGTCGAQSASPSSETVPATVCESDGGDCCEAMFAASRTQKIVAAQPKPEPVKPAAPETK